MCSRHAFICGQHGRMLTKAMDVRLCGRILTNYAPNFVTNVSKQSMECVGKRINQLKVISLREVRNIRHNSTSSVVCSLTCII